MLSITATGFSGVSTARVEFGDIQGKRNEDLNTFGEYVENKKPDVVLANQTDVKIVAGVETKVPEVIARDASGLKGDVDYTVWYNYANPSTRRTIAVKNGKFTPNALGTYTIEYRVEDVYGNKQTKLLDLIAVKTATSGISIDVDEVESANIGSEVDLSRYTVNSLCQNPTVAVTVIAPSGNVVNLTSSASNYSVNEIGDYKVKYTYSDAFYSGEYEYTMTSVFGGKAIFEKNAVPEGRYRGGATAYGYKMVNNGRNNYKGKPVLDITVDEDGEAPVVRLIYFLARERNMGCWAIAKYLNDNGYKTRHGGLWTNTQVRQILTNPIYKGYYELRQKKNERGNPKVVSPFMPELVIISEEEWNATQEVMDKRATRKKGIKNTNYGSMLLAGLKHLQSQVLFSVKSALGGINPLAWNKSLRGEILLRKVMDRRI